MHRIICILLFAVGVSLFLYRWQVLDFPVSPDQDSILWQLEAQIDIEGDGESARVGLFVPSKSGQFAAVQENFLSEAMALTTQTDAVGNRSAIWSTAELSRRTSVFYRSMFYRLPAGDVPERPQTPPSDLPEEFVNPPERSTIERTAARRIARDVDPQAADISTMAALVIDRLRAPGSSEHVRALVDDNADTGELASAAAYVISTAGTPSRQVHGLPLGESRRQVTPWTWIEVWTGSEWEAFNVETSDPFVPEDYLVLWRGPQELISVEGASVERTSIGLSRVKIGPIAALTQRTGLSKHPLAEANLLRLSVNSQLVFQILLMIPVGVLVLVIMRQMIGVQTFGTFMPVLIALAFRVTDLFYGLLFFSILVSAGMTARFFLSKLNLLLVPRLASMLIIVIMFMIAISSFADALSLGLGLSVSLFPIVILTMTIERLSVTLEENGAGAATKETLGSVAVAVAAYLTMNVPVLQHLMFVFPELLLVVLAITMMIGRYSGYRLSELYRFRDFARTP